MFPVMRFEIDNISMEPTFHPGDHIFVSKYFLRKPKEGDIIVFRHPQKEMKLIKRIVKIKNNKYFVEGDNKLYSSDSRGFGPIEKDSIIGKVIFLKDKIDSRVP